MWEVMVLPSRAFTGATWVKVTMGAAVPMAEPALFVIDHTQAPMVVVPETKESLTATGTNTNPLPAWFQIVGPFAVVFVIRIAAAVVLKMYI
jgi:hypothetical protein